MKESKKVQATGAEKPTQRWRAPRVCQQAHSQSAHLTDRLCLASVRWRQVQMAPKTLAHGLTSLYLLGMKQCSSGW